MGGNHRLLVSQKQGRAAGRSSQAGLWIYGWGFAGDEYGGGMETRIQARGSGSEEGMEANPPGSVLASPCPFPAPHEEVLALSKHGNQF